MILQGEPAKAALGKGGKGKRNVNPDKGKSGAEEGAGGCGRKSKAAKDAELAAHVGEKCGGDEAGCSVRKSH